MPITIHSPHSGQQVKIRDQDVGRAVRDEQGRIFYVVQRHDGSGYYAAPTRKGSERDEQRYDRLIQTEARGQAAATAQQQVDKQAIHDATGKRRIAPAIRLVVILLILIALALAGYLLWFDRDIPYLNEVDGQSTTQPQKQTNTSSMLPEPVRDAFTLFNQQQRAYPLETPVAKASADDRLSAYAKPRTLAAYQGSVPSASDARISAQARQLMASGGRGNITAPDTEVNGPTEVSQVAMGNAPDDRAPAVGTFFADQSAKPQPHKQVGHASHTELVGYRVLCGVELLNGSATLQLNTIKAGHGPSAQSGDTVRIHYKAFVAGANQPFHNTRLAGEPLALKLGAGEVIPGLEMGLIGMREGQVRTIHIPSYLAYGQRGIGSLIPPGAGLIYRVELIDVQ